MSVERHFSQMTVDINNSFLICARRYAACYDRRYGSFCISIDVLF
jgi:hypothetical protein